MGSSGRNLVTSKDEGIGRMEGFVSSYGWFLTSEGEVVSLYQAFQRARVEGNHNPIDFSMASALLLFLPRATG